MKIITDKNKIDEVLKRGVERIYPKREILEKILMSGKRIRLYCGYDPSAPALHIGNAITLKKLAQFQALGHEVIFLIGDFTGMIGDPTDKTAVRKKLTRQQVLANAENYKKQASAYIKFSGANPAKIMRNSQWHDKLSFKDLIEITSNFTVQQMLERDMFEKRYRGEIQCAFCATRFTNPFSFLTQNTIASDFEPAKFIKCPKCGKKVSEMLKTGDQSKLIQMFIQPKPIYLHEFLYPVAQAYDSVAMDVDLEIGGNDQTFNMLCGRDLMKAMKNKEKFVLTMKLLVDAGGKKMGKSEGNIVNLDESPENMYGQIMSWPDGLIEAGLELCANLDTAEVKAVAKKIAAGANPRDGKMRLAFEVTKINHGEEKATAAQEYFVKTVQRKEIPVEVKSEKLKIKSMNIMELLVKIKLAGSKGEARRLIEQDGVKVDGEVVKDINKEVEITKDGVLLQKGKRGFMRVMLK